MTPKKIEGTIYAFLTGTMSLSTKIISAFGGSFLNLKYVGVNKDDLSGYSTLCLFTLIGSVLTFATLPLVPLKEQIE